MKKVISLVLLLILLCGCSKNEVTTPTQAPTQAPTNTPITLVTPTVLPTVTPTLEQIKDTKQAFVAMVDTDILNLRQEALLSSKIVSKLKKGDIVQVMLVNDGWCKIHKVVSSASQDTNAKYAYSEIGYCKAEYLQKVADVSTLYGGAVWYTLKSGEYTADVYRYFAEKKTYGDASVEYYFTDVYIYDKDNNLYSIMPLSFAGYADKENINTHVLTSIFMYDFDFDGKDDCLYQLDYDTHVCYLDWQKLEHLRDFGPEGTGVVNLMLYREGTLVNSGFEDQFVFEGTYSQEDFNSKNINKYFNVFAEAASNINA